MTENSGQDNLITCTKRKCRYIINEDIIINDFGFNRLRQRYNTCKRCWANRHTKQHRNRLAQEEQPHQPNTQHREDKLQLYITTLNGEEFVI
jgi:hypothetical protein